MKLRLLRIILRKQDTSCFLKIIYCDLNLNISFPRDDINCGLNLIPSFLVIINVDLLMNKYGLFGVSSS